MLNEPVVHQSSQKRPLERLREPLAAHDAGKDHLAAAGGKDADDLGIDATTEKRPAVVDDDHRAVFEVADRLAFVLAGFDEVDLDRLAHHEFGAEGLGEEVEVEPLHAVKLGHLAEVVVGGEELGAHRLGEEDELGVDIGALADLALGHADVEVLEAAKFVEDVEPAAAAGLLVGVGRIGDRLEFGEDEARDDEGGVEEAGLADTGNAAVDQHAGVDDDERDIDLVRDETDVGDDEVELVLAAEGDDGREIGADDEEHQLEEVNDLGIADGEERRGADEVGDERADAEPEGDGGEAAERKALEEDVDENDQRADEEADEGGEDTVRIPVADRIAQEPATRATEDEEDGTDRKESFFHQPRRRPIKQKSAKGNTTPSTMHQIRMSRARSAFAFSAESSSISVRAHQTPFRMTTQYWLVKSEPEAYAWADLVRDGRTDWTGVRNYAARLNLNAMQPGDPVLFYESVSTKAVRGIAQVTKAAFPDRTAEEPGWVAVELEAAEPLKQPVTLAAIKAEPKLAQIALLRQSRLSVMPLTAEAFRAIVKMGGGKAG